jgi:DNA-binding CsgD family transcriptional regulator
MGEREPVLADYYVVKKMSGLVSDAKIAKALGLTVKTIRKMRRNQAL